MGASRRSISRRVVVVFVLLAGLSVIASESDGAEKIAPWLTARLQEGQAEALVLLEDEALPADGLQGPEAVYRELTARARDNQHELLRWLDEQGLAYRRFYLIDAVLVKLDLSLARTIAARPEVRRLVGNPQLQAVEPANPAGASLEAGSDGVEWGVEMVGATTVWNDRKVRGEGGVVLSMDTGVEWGHPAIRNKYRGWDAASATADHRYSWHDAIDDSATPWDDNDHGTHTVGTMVGDDDAGQQIGVAPGARWIACRNMDRGLGTPARYIECMEWALAPYPPGGDPLRDGRPEFAPQIANNSWGCPPSEGCDAKSFDQALARLRRAGIWMIAAAGNDGPSCNSMGNPPSISSDVFTVGAVSRSRTTAYFSSRGPVTIDGSNRLKPDLSAPGDGVRSSVRGGGYSSFSGTSMASPHVAGCAALLWSAVPQLRGQLEISECLLRRSAQNPVHNYFSQSCGGIPQDTYPNAVAGWGIINIDDALSLPSSDGDIVADLCDCAPTDGGSFALPVEIKDLHFTNAQTLAWTSQASSAGSGTSYDLLRGELETLLSAGNVSSADCLAGELGSADHSDPAQPAAGSGYYYLVRAKNSCGNSGYGSSSSGITRNNAACQRFEAHSDGPP